MEAYLDNAATTRVLPGVRDRILEVMETDYGNPSSKHSKGMEAELCLRQASEVLSGTLKCKPQELIYTSGGTEANNLALLGTATAKHRMGKHIVTTKMEHASVVEPLVFLEEQGYEVTYLDVDAMGHVDMQELCASVRDDTILVSVMYVNNEIGAVQDIGAFGSAIKERNKNTVFHVDAIQAYGKYRITPKRLGVDLMSVSGHKIHAPKGIGFLYVRENTKLNPILFGGGQQRGMRSGTENVPGIVGMAEAAGSMYKEHARKTDDMYRLKEYLIEGLREMEGVTVNAVLQENSGLPFESAVRHTAPHIVSASFAGVRSEVLLHALAEKGIYVSSGSACSSNRPELSGTLKAIGVEDKLLDSTLRFSFSVQTTEEELAYTLGELREILPKLRKFRRK